MGWCEHAICSWENPDDHRHEKKSLLIEPEGGLRVTYSRTMIHVEMKVSVVYGNI